MGRIALALFVVLVVPSAAWAQDFGIDWIDRVTHEREVERGPATPHAASYTASAGVLYYYDNNIFLEERNLNRNHVLVPFVRGRLDYAEPVFEASADALLDYKAYSHDHDSDDYEQRFYGHARYVGTRFNAEVTELIRHDSDPTDVLFIDRVRRLISDTNPRFIYDLTKTFAFEASGNIEFVRFEKRPFSVLDDNNSFRFDGAVVYRAPNGYDWLVKGGYILIDYVSHQRNGAPPDVDGYYIDGGFRGDLSPRLSLEATIGYTHVESVKFILTDSREQRGTLDAGIHLRFEPIEKVKVYGDYTRLLTFAGGNFAGTGAPDPFQTVDRFVAIGEYQWTEQFSVRARVQYDHASSSLGVVRDYTSLGGSATYKFTEYLMVEAGGTYRLGDTRGNVITSQHFKEYIGHAGVVLTY